MAKPKLRHIAITVPDPEETAAFYEKTFGLERVYESAFGVLMSDGTVSLAILNFPTNGGRYHMRIPSRQDSPTEVKFRDPNGVVFDIVTEEYASKSWYPKADPAE